MFVAKPVTIEIVASGVGPAEISLHTAGTTTAEYVGDAGFAFKVLQEGDGVDNKDAPLNNITTATINNHHDIKPSNLTRSNGHLPQQQQPVTKTTHNKNYFFSRKNENNKQQQQQQSGTTGVNMTFLQSLDAKLQRLHDYAGRNRRSRRAAPSDAAPDNSRNPAGTDDGGMNNKSSHLVQHKRPFMTVVRQGTFLKPPPELAALLGLSLDSSQGSSSQGSEASLHQHNMLYSFSSQPRVLQHRQRRDAVVSKAAVARRQRRDLLSQDPGQDHGQELGQDTPDDGPLHSNLMYDRRVVRGNTFAHNPLPTSDAQEATAAALRQAEARRRALARRRARGAGAGPGAARHTYTSRSGTPPPVHGRQHLDVQTDRYLEEIFDKPLESEVCCQTDLFLERPATPKYVPATTGKDAETQILPGELFDFEEEVAPILEVLVGRTVEQALVEVLEEEELAATQRQRARLAEVRVEQQAEQARLEGHERRLRFEKEMVQERRVAEHAAARRAQREAGERVAAVAVSKGFLEELLPSVLDNLQHDGAQVSQEFMPWLMAEVQDEVQKLVTNKDVISDIVREVLETHAELKRTLGPRSPSRSRSRSSSRSSRSRPSRHGDDRGSPTSSSGSDQSTCKVGESGDAEPAAERQQPV